MSTSYNHSTFCDSHVYLLELDIAHDSIHIIPETEQKYDIVFKLVTENGPAGGNPLYNIYFSSFNTIKSFLQNEYNNIMPFLNIEENLDLDPESAGLY